MTRIQDGTGGSKFAKVNDNNKLETVAIVTDIQQDASINKRLYRVSVPVINLTSSSESAILYFKNNENAFNLIVPEIIIACGGSTGGGKRLVQSVGRAGIVSGTIVSDTNPASIIPLNTSVTTAPAIDVYVGGEGKTAVQALDIPSYAGFPQNSRTPSPFFITVEPGNNVALTIQPPAGNSSLDVQIDIRVYLDPIDNGN